MTDSRITLRPDPRRPRLENIVTLNSLSHVASKSPRVLLLVPPYTRIVRPLDRIKSNLQLEVDIRVVEKLQRAGIYDLQEMKRAGIPLGLLRVGTAAREAGYEVTILDAAFEGWKNDTHLFTTNQGSEIWSYGLSQGDIEEKIRSFRPDVIGITIDYTHQWGNARAMADLVKSIGNDIIVVMGGTHAHGLPHDVLLDSPTDYVVFGPADTTFVELLDVLSQRSRKALEEVAGIAYKKKGEVIITRKRSFGKEIANNLIPDLSLVDLSLYSGPYHSAGKRVRNDGYLLYGFTTIGCNTKCDFCAIPAVQGPWIPMSDKMREDYLSYIVSQGVTEFIVEDDHLFHDPQNALRVFESLREYNLKWFEEGGVGLFNLIALLPEVDRDFVLESVSNRAVFARTLKAKGDGLTAEHVIQQMARSGCYGVYLAVESANEDSLETSRKPTLNALEKYTKKVVALFGRYGINTTCGLMIGFVNPNGTTYVESRDQIRRTIEYGRTLRQAGAAYINPFIFTPLPGAPHFSDLKSLVDPNTDEGYSHEFATMDAPDGQWNKDELNILRVRSLLHANGIESYRRMRETGTWPT